MNTWKVETDLERMSTFEKLFELSGDAILLLEGLKLQNCNRAAFRLFGYNSMEELLNVPENHLSPEYQPDGSPSMERALEMIELARKRGSHRFEWQFIRSTGEEFPAEVRITAIPVKEGELLHAVVRESGDQKRAEQALRISQENLAKAQAITHFGSYTVSLPDRKELLWSEELYRIVGLDPKIPITSEMNPVERFVHPDDQARMQQIIQNGSSQTQPISLEYRVITEDGRVKYVHSIGETEFDSEGKPVRFVGTLMDITARKLAENLRAGQSRALEQIATGCPLPDVLESLVHLVEEGCPGAVPSVSLLDDSGERLWLGCSCKLPIELIHQLDGIEVTDCGCPCSQAVAQHRRVIVEDVLQLPECGSLSCGIRNRAMRACWSQPITGADGHVFGVFAVYFPDPARPAGEDLMLLETAAHLAGIAIERVRAEEALVKANNELEKRVAARTLELEQANADLTKERTLLDAVLRQMPAGLIIAENASQTLILCNEQYARLWRVEPDRVRSLETLAALQRFHLDGSPYTVEELPMTRSMHSGEIVTDEEMVILRNDGTKGVVRVSAAPIIDSNGTAVAVVGSFQDITDLKNVQDAMGRLYDEMELQVQERTAELALANTVLKREVSERKRAEQVSRGQAFAIASALQELTARSDLDAFLGQTLRSINQQLQDDGVALWLYDEMDDSIAIRVAYKGDNRVPEKELGLPGKTVQPSAKMPFWKEFEKNRLPITIYDLSTDPRIFLPSSRKALLEHGYKSMLAVPMLLGERLIGWISTVNKRYKRYRPEEIELAMALAQQATLAVQLAELSRQGQQTAVLSERNRMAREIHDTLAQGFTGIIVQLQVVELALQKQPDKAFAVIARARDLARDSLSEARRSVWALRPNMLESRSLADAFRQLLELMTQETTIQTEFAVTGESRPLSPEVEHNLLRIGQEAVTNALKYSQAGQIRLSLEFSSDEVCLEVLDNGVGFAAGTKPRGSGFGLIGMRERAGEIRGHFQIETNPGSGTRVLVRAPIR